MPDYDCTLISVSKLLKQTGCIAIFTDTLYVLHDRFSRTLIGAGEEREGVYYFTGVKVAQVNASTSSKPTSAVLWHRRLGHVFMLNKLEQIFLIVLIKLRHFFLLYIVMSGDFTVHLLLLVQNTS